MLGLGAGASVNQLVAYQLTLPKGAQARVYTDNEPAAPSPTTPKAPGPSDDGQEVSDEGEEGKGEPEEGPSEASEPRPNRTLPPGTYAEIIVRRNIFDSTAVYQPPAQSSSSEGECVSDDSLRLLATMVADPPTYSSALIAEGAARSARARPYAVGESVGSQGKITYIAQKRVCMDGGSCVCMGQSGTLAQAERSGEGAVAEVGAGTSDGSVTKTGENSYAVERAFLEEQLGNAEALAGQIRPRPHRGADGEVDGYRLSSIKRGSVFDKLGVKNGDVIHSVNGQSMNSVEGAMSAYSGLSREKSFTFEITRRNQKVTLDYSVR